MDQHEAPCNLFDRCASDAIVDFFKPWALLSLHITAKLQALHHALLSAHPGDAKLFRNPQLTKGGKSAAKAQGYKSSGLAYCKKSGTRLEVGMRLRAL